VVAGPRVGAALGQRGGNGGVGGGGLLVACKKLLKGRRGSGGGGFVKVLVLGREVQEFTREVLLKEVKSVVLDDRISTTTTDSFLDYRFEYLPTTYLSTYRQSIRHRVLVCATASHVRISTASLLNTSPGLNCQP
jgi:hypothetical protein